MLIVGKTFLCSGCNASPFWCALEAREQIVVVADRGTRRRSMSHSLPHLSPFVGFEEIRSLPQAIIFPTSLHHRALHMVSYVAITLTTDLTPRDPEAERTTMSCTRCKSTGSSTLFLRVVRRKGESAPFGKESSTRRLIGKDVKG